MNLKFPLDDVTLKEVETTRAVNSPLQVSELWQINQNEFAMQVDGVGSFYICNGNHVEYTPAPDSGNEWINIYLNGHILAAIMHQRKIINFHASSFIHNQTGIMILGETGAGKSSLTAAFTLSDGGFLSDDFTPILFHGNNPLIWPVYKKIKLRENTIHQLGIQNDRISEQEKVSSKYFLLVEKAKVENFPLQIIFKIEVGNNTTPIFLEPDASEKFTLLRSEICLWEMLAGMPETEKAYLQQLINMVSQVKIVKIVRPQTIGINELKNIITDFMDKGILKM